MAYDFAERNHASCDECHYKYFFIAVKEGNFEEATRAYNELKDSRSFQTTNIPNAVIGKYIEIAAKSGDLDTAITVYQAAIDNGSLDEVMQGIMITALINHRCYEEAQEIFGRAPAFKVSETGRELEELGYDFHGYSHGEGVCAIRSLLTLNPEQTRIRVMTGQGNHSRHHPLFEFQRYIQNYVISEMPGWSCRQPLRGNPGVYEIKLDV
ncbi:MAG: hypothetical protein FJZ56_01830 [Chlamydiae bacterium]|nr:hypothetical protein [Chlamydiota bacterium]